MADRLGAKEETAVAREHSEEESEIVPQVVMAEADKRFENGALASIPDNDAQKSTGLPENSVPDQAPDNQIIAQDHSALARDTVLAIVAYHNEPLEFLESTLDALAAQNHKPDRILVVISDQAKNTTDFEPDCTLQIPEISQLCTSVHEKSGIECTPLCVEETNNFGESIAKALAELPDHPKLNNPASDSTVFAPDFATRAEKTWYWLLHTDSAPFPDTLDLMLKTGEDSRMIGAIGPKQVFWQAHPDGSFDLLEVGINATRLARRVPDVILGERDQGQLDRREDVLAVGSAGMLIRAEVFQKIGGFNPHLGPFGDGLELSRRVHLAGYRVVVCPAARIRHAQLSLRPQLRQMIGHTAIPQGLPQTNRAEISDSELATSYPKRRAAQIFNALLAVPTIVFPFALTGYLLSAVIRSLIRLSWRDFRRAGGELKAAGVIFRRFRAIRAGRSEIAKFSSKNQEASLRNLAATNKDIRKAKQSHREAFSEAKKMALMPDPLTLKARQDLARHQRNGLLYATLGSLIFAIALFLPYFSAGALAGGQLALDTTTGTQLWNIAKHSWMISGDGSLNQLDPLWLLYLPLLLLGQPAGFTLGLTITITLYLTPIIGVIGAYLFAGRFTRAWIVRCGTAIFWSLSPAFIEALHEGRIGPALVHAFLPLFAWCFAGALRKKPGKIGFAALLLAVMAAGAPILLPLGIAVAMLSFVFNRRWSWLWLPVPAGILLFPQLIRLSQIDQDALLTYFFANPGVPLTNSIVPLDVLRGYTTIPFSMQHFTNIGFISLLALVAIALLALFRSGATAKQVRIGWIIAIGGLSAAVGVLYLPAPEINHYGQISAGIPWHGTFVSFAWLGLFIALTAGAHGLRTSLSARSFGTAQIAGIFAIAIFPLALLGLSATSIYLQLDPTNRVLQAANTKQIPAIAADNMESPARSRVLALVANPNQDQSNTAEYKAELWRNAGLQLHEYTLVANATPSAGVHSDLANSDLSQVIADLLVASPDAAKSLQEHGISVVLLPPPATSEISATTATASPLKSNRDLFNSDNSALLPQETTESNPARDDLAATLRAVPGLEYVTENETGIFWRVIPKDGLNVAARAWIEDADGNRTPLDAGASDLHTEVANLPARGKIVLAERADTGWHARLDGVELTNVAANNNWAQAWDLGSTTGISAGTLEIWHSNPLHRGIFTMQLLLGAISIVAALPLRSRKAGDLS